MQRPFALSLDANGDLDRYTVRAHPLPKDVPLILGDAIHNLRASLDLLAGDLAELSGQDRKGVRFPFCKEEGKFDTVLKWSKFKRASPDLVSMVRVLCPWEGALRALHDLDLADKHEMILPTLTFLQGTNFRMWMGPETVEMSLGMSATATPISAAAVEDRLNASFRVVFPRADIGQADLREVEVAPKLLQFAQLVEGIIQTFEAHCLGG